jgi:hypothetical protein
VAAAVNSGGTASDKISGSWSKISLFLFLVSALVLTVSLLVWHSAFINAPAIRRCTVSRPRPCFSLSLSLLPPHLKAVIFEVERAERPSYMPRLPGRTITSHSAQAAKLACLMTCMVSPSQLATPLMAPAAHLIIRKEKPPSKKFGCSSGGSI